MCRLFAFLVIALVGLGGCESTVDQASNERPSAEAIVDSAIAAHGGSVLDQALVTFDFRGDRFRIRRNEGQFHYRRTATDSLGRSIEEGLTNDSLYRRVDGESVSLSDDERVALDTRVNSVVYFALLPYPLGDPAAQPHYSGRDTIDGSPYHRIRVTFRQDDGDQDWQDVFMYWFHTDSYDMDFLAYAFGLGPEEEAGTRFREAYNVRRINGVRVADYYNYTSDTLATDRLEQYPLLWTEDALDLVSQVELDSVEVRPLNDS